MEYFHNSPVELLLKFVDQIGSWFAQAKGRDVDTASLSSDRKSMYSEVKFERVGDIIERIKKTVVKSPGKDDVILIKS